MNKGIIKADHLSVSYNDMTALVDVSFSIPEGSFTAIIGPNGAGKSTLIKVMLGLISPDSGQIRINGVLPQKLDKRYLGYVPQFKTMNREFPVLVRELVYSGFTSSWPWAFGKEKNAIAIEALKSVKAGHLANRPIKNLSGGELQRVCLARSFVKNPSIVLLDEPAAGIDAFGEADLYAMLENYQQEHKATVIMITHDWQVAKHHASHIILLNQKLIKFGEPEIVLEEQNIRAAFGHLGHSHPYRKNGIVNV